MPNTGSTGIPTVDLRILLYHKIRVHNNISNRPTARFTINTGGHDDGEHDNNTRRCLYTMIGGAHSYFSAFGKR